MKRLLLFFPLMLAACGPMTYEEFSTLEKRCLEIGGTVYVENYKSSQQLHSMLCELPGGIRFRPGNF